MFMTDTVIELINFSLTESWQMTYRVHVLLRVLSTSTCLYVEQSRMM